MCSPIQCRACGKTTWSGCGEHVADVRADVPTNQWCDGHDGGTEASGPWPHQRVNVKIGAR